MKRTASTERTMLRLKDEFITERVKWAKSAKGLRTIPHTSSTWQHVRSSYKRGLEEGWAACYEAMEIANQK